MDMSQGTFSEADVNSLCNKIAEFGQSLGENEKKLLDLLVASATMTVVVEEIETIEPINTDLKLSTNKALSRFINRETKYTAGRDDNIYAWRR